GRTSPGEPHTSAAQSPPRDQTLSALRLPSAAELVPPVREPPGTGPPSPRREAFLSPRFAFGWLDPLGSLASRDSILIEGRLLFGPKRAQPTLTLNKETLRGTVLQ